MVYEEMNILLPEDNSAAVELTLRALRQHNLANNLPVVKDGVAALDFLFGAGKFSGSNPKNLKVVLLT